MDRGAMASPPFDAASSIYPDRPIRPLPKRKIRSRLSSEVANTISYPLVVPSSPPSFIPTHPPVDHRVHPSVRHSADGHRSNDNEDADHEYHECEYCANHPSSEDEGDYRGPLSYRPRMWSEEQQQPVRARPETKHQPPPANSSNSSADGYESFENTNNKKKRKIPISGGLGALAADVPGARVPTQSVNVPYPDTARPGGLGSAGAGRDRGRKSGRFLNDRKPLANASHNVGLQANGTYAAAEAPHPVSASKSANSQTLTKATPENGIISKSIASAGVSKSTAPATGQENVSLLQRQKQAKDGQNFTFECKSDSAAELVADEKRMAQAPLPPTFQKANTVPAAKGRTPAGQPANGAVPAPAQYPASGQPAAQAPPPQKPRRDPNWWLRAANRRKEQKRSDNYYNPPDPNNPLDNYWCPFCEFEDIYGVPFMLGRRYEIKERRRRRERETNQKRLEAAKAKSRKGKKSKNSTKSSNAANTNANAPPAQPYDPAYGDPPQDDVSQGEDFFDDEYDDGMAPPARVATQGDAYGRPKRAAVPGAYDLPELDRSKSLPNM